jgi:hypothetical protein
LTPTPKYSRSSLFSFGSQHTDPEKRERVYLGLFLFAKGRIHSGIFSEKRQNFQGSAELGYGIPAGHVVEMIHRDIS